MAFNPLEDLDEIHRILRSDGELLGLLDLKTDVDIMKRILRRSKWDDLATNEKRLCIYFIPDRPTPNESFLDTVFQVDVHVPASLDYVAWQVLARVKILLHKKRINKKYAKFYGQLGELPTMQGFFSCGGRFKFYRSI